ncbi:MAG TPA: sigma-70 family RNA polymerase sigma factor [Thermoanaerobaculia bacterium]|nr:sigma-70 family RNA polymerase sigma factor [Thermoanaerobaculia bacterium]
MTGALALTNVPKPRPAAPSTPSRPWLVPALPPASTDEELLARIAGGDQEALADLYDRYARVTLGLLHRIFGDSGEAEEVVQEVFLQVWRDAASYRPERASAKSWLLLLARSRGLDRLKSCGARRRREDAVALEARGQAVAPLGSRRLERADTRRRVREALAGLPVEQRAALELAFFEGLTHVQVAERLAAPLGTIKSRVLLGMRKLKTALAGEDGALLQA